MSQWDTVQNVDQVGLLGYQQVVLKNVAGGTLYYSSSNQVSPTLNDGNLTAGQSHTFVATVYIVSASRTTVSGTWSNPSVGGGTPGHLIEASGTPQPQEAALNFTGAGVSVSDNAGNGSTDITISGVSAGVNQLVAGTAIGVSPGGGTGTVTVNNTGVTSAVAGTGVGVSGATGAVTISNTGVTSNVAGTGIGVSGATGTSTISNTGVTSAIAGSGIGVSGATGAVTFSNTGVTSIVAGSNISISGGTGAVTINSTGGGGGGTTAATGPGGVAGANVGASQTLAAPSGYRLWWGVLNANTTITMPTPVADTNFVLRLDQDNVGGRTLTFAVSPAVSDPTGMLNVVGGVSTGIVSTANQTNWIRFESDGFTWYAFPDTAGTPSTDQANQARFSLGITMATAQAAGLANVASLSGSVTLDTSYVTQTGDQVLLTAQSTTSQNGLWVTAAGVWARPSCYPSGGKVGGFLVHVLGGTTDANTLWTTANTTPVTIDTGGTSWTKKV